MSQNSSNAKIFDQAKVEYEEALKNSGYKDSKLTYEKKPQEKKARSRKRNIIWFNPPFNKAVSTNVSKLFLNFIDKHFTKRNGLYKVFNRNNVKVSYSCMENVRSIINSHNKKLSTKKVNNEDPLCKCDTKEECPLDGKCCTESIVYKCEVTAPEKPSTEENAVVVFFLLIYSKQKLNPIFYTLNYRNYCFKRRITRITRGRA